MRFIKYLKFNEKNLIFILIPVAFIITLIFPLLYLSIFSQPNAEDFSLSFTSKETNPFYSVLTLYQNGDGRLFTNLLYAVNPLVYNLLWGYKLIPLFVFALFFIVIGHFLKTLFGRNDIKVLLFSVTIVFVVFISRLPSIPHAFYWMASSLNYTVSALLLVFLIDCLISQTVMNTTDKFSIYSFIISALLIFIIIFSNEIYILLMLIFFALLTVISFHHNKSYKYLILTFLICTGSAALTPLLPRIILDKVLPMTSHPINNDLISAFKLCLVSTFKNIISWTLFNPVLLVATVFIIVLKKHIVFSGKLFQILTFKNLYTIGFMVFVFMIITLLPYYIFRENSHVPQRVFNVQYLFFVLFWFVGVITFITVKENLFNMPRGITLVIAFVLIISVFSSQNVIVLYSDLFNGVARRFNKEMNERYDIFSKSKEINMIYKVSVIKPLEDKPATIYFPPDILPNRAYALWNDAYERYFGVDEVRFEKDTLRFVKNLQ